MQRNGHIQMVALNVFQVDRLHRKLFEKKHMFDLIKPPYDHTLFK
jgi:hypothetical protein